MDAGFTAVSFWEKEKKQKERQKNRIGKGNSQTSVWPISKW